MAKIFINPGHDELSLQGTPDYDCGACNEDMGLYENEICAAVGALVVDYLTAAGCECNLLQSESLSCICAAANEWGADYFISIHTNASDNPSASGVETYAYSASGQGYALAEDIVNGLAESTGLQNRGVKLRPSLYVLRKTNMPAVLSEIGFITNPRDAALMSGSPELFARGIYNGIVEFTRRP